MLAKPVKSERRVELQARNEFFKISLLNISLGGERSILLSYRDIYSIFGLFPGFLELQPVLRRLRRAVLLIKKRSIFDRFISSLRVIDPSAIVRREVGTVASGVISQEDLNSQQICPFSADSCSPFCLGVAPIRHREVTSNAKKCLEIQGFSAFQIPSDTTL